MKGGGGMRGGHIGEGDMCGAHKRWARERVMRRVS